MNIFLVIIFSCFTWALDVDLYFHAQEIYQGEIASAEIVIRSNVTNFQWATLKGQTLGKTVYVFDLDPMIKKVGSESLTSSAKVIFTKVPEAGSIKDTIGGHEINLRWNEVKVLPVEVPQNLLFGDFDIPARPKILLWISIIFGLLLLLGLCFLIYKKLKFKKELKEKRSNLFLDLTSAKKYEEVVEVWKKKQKYIQEFPEIEEDFKKFESILFKYQFKPHRTEEEVRQVLEVYKSFVSKVQVSFHGI